MQTPLIVGLDVGRGYAIACPYDSANPATRDLVTFIHKYKPIRVEASPIGLKKLIEVGEVFALEPTGKDHHWWVSQLEAAGKLVLLVSGLRVRNHARNRGVMSKGDKEDAAAIGSFAAEHLASGNEKAFLSLGDTSSQIRQLRQQIIGCQKQKNLLINQLKSRLAVEAPDLCKFKLSYRDWGKPPSKQWEELKSDDRLSWLSQDDCNLIIQLEQRECRLEQALTRAINSITDYQEVWQRWGFNERQISAILGALHPIDQFMGERGQAISHTHTKDGKRIKVNHTLRGIQRCLGYGRTKFQSGDSWKWGRTGDQSVLTALYLWVDIRVAVGRCANRTKLFKRIGKPDEFDRWSKKQQDKWLDDHRFRSLCEQWEPRVEAVRQLNKARQREGFLPWYDEALIEKVIEFNQVSRPIAQCQLYYEFSHQGLNKHERILKTLPFMIRLLTRDLVNYYLESR